MMLDMQWDALLRAIERLKRKEKTIWLAMLRKPRTGAGRGIDTIESSAFSGSSFLSIVILWTVDLLSAIFGSSLFLLCCLRCGLWLFYRF
jgi:hypothetical protein